MGGAPGEDAFDVVVVGAGMGGIYGIHRFRQQGLSVLGIEGAPDVGGVWYHNAYPGARVDVESEYYCYMFDRELYVDWKWKERYASQPEILAYLNHVADRFDVRRHICFNTWVTGARWSPAENRWFVQTDDGRTRTSRYLVMASGQLSKARDPDFAGLADFHGEWYQTSHWPRQQVDLIGKRVAVIGTGSSGVQAITAIAPQVEHLHVFQRTPNYSAPAHNRPTDAERFDRLAVRLDTAWGEVLRAPAGNLFPPTAGPAGSYTAEEQQKLLEQRWAFGGQPMLSTFSDQGVDAGVNAVVSEFVRSKIRQKIDDPAVAAKLLPDAYPIGVRRMCVDTGYYETFNRDNVTLVSLRDEPIERLTATGIQTRDRHVELDVIVFAIGFEAFTGALDVADLRNEEDERPQDGWRRGPRTYFGLMTGGFPNLFLITGPGSPSVLANMNAANVQHLDFVAELIAHADARGARRVEPREEAIEAWTAQSAAAAANLIRRQVDNYMVHVNRDDGSRVFIPYAGGFGDYVTRIAAEAASGYPGLCFS